jgi:hypothetical protein
MTDVRELLQTFGALFAKDLRDRPVEPPDPRGARVPCADAVDVGALDLEETRHFFQPASDHVVHEAGLGGPTISAVSLSDIVTTTLPDAARFRLIRLNQGVLARPPRAQPG